MIDKENTELKLSKLDSLLIDFRQSDSFTCPNKRNVDIIDTIVKQRRLLGKSITEITNTFGCPNKSIKIDDNISIVEYSFSCICGKNNKIVYAYGHSRFQFYNNKLVAFGNLIE